MINVIPIVVTKIIFKKIKETEKRSKTIHLKISTQKKTIIEEMRNRIKGIIHMEDRQAEVLL